MTYTVPTLHDFNGYVIRGERSLQRYGNHDSQGQRQSICLILQLAVSAEETAWSAARRGEERRKGEAKKISL